MTANRPSTILPWLALAAMYGGFREPSPTARSFQSAEAKADKLAAAELPNGS